MIYPGIIHAAGRVSMKEDDLRLGRNTPIMMYEEGGAKHVEIKQRDLITAC